MQSWATSFRIFSAQDEDAFSVSLHFYASLRRLSLQTTTCKFISEWSLREFSLQVSLSKVSMRVFFLRKLFVQVSLSNFSLQFSTCKFCLQASGVQDSWLHICIVLSRAKVERNPPVDSGMGCGTILGHHFSTLLLASCNFRAEGDSSPGPLGATHESCQAQLQV